MSVKYAFQNGSERLFGTAYEFSNEAQKEQTQSALRSVLGESLIAVRSFAKARPFDPAEATAWLGANGMSQEKAASCQALFPKLPVPAPVVHVVKRPPYVHPEKSTAKQAPPAPTIAPKPETPSQRPSGIDVAALRALRATLPAGDHVHSTISQFRSIPAQARPPVPSQKADHKAAIERIVLERGIQYLTHFTRIDNLPSILRHGIMSRQVLGDTACKWNDPERKDRRRHASCLSISHPNYKMFWDYRKQNPEQLWAVITLKPSLLWELDCGFVEINAASGSRGVPERAEEALKTTVAFELMFGEPDLRDELELPTHYPTNPQAEVLVFETIPLRYILDIRLNAPPNPQLNSAIDEAQQQNIRIKQDKAIFLYRKDYKHWTKPEWSSYG